MLLPVLSKLKDMGVKTWNPGYSALTKITEFHDFGTKFELDRIFNFFHIEGGCHARHLSKTEFLAVVSKMAILSQIVIFDIW